MAIKKLYSSDSRRKTISKLNSNFVAITPDVILEISDKSPTENMDNTIWIDTSMDIRDFGIDTKTYADEYFASHPTIDKNTFKYIGDDGKPTLEFKKMIYGDDYNPDSKYVLQPKNGTIADFCKPIERQTGVKPYNLNDIVFNTKSVNTLFQAFINASNLESVNTSSWDISNVTNTNNMFFNCKSLTSLDVSKWNTSKVTNMSAMFYICKSLTSLDVSKWNTSNVTEMANMFLNCSGLTSLDVSKWNTSNVTDMSGIFNSCQKLQSIDVSKWNTSNLINTANMFNTCSLLTSLDLSNWDTSNIKYMSFMFANCRALTTITGILDFKNCIYYNGMFLNCTKLTSVKVKNLPVDIDTFCRGANIDKSKVIVVQ